MKSFVYLDENKMYSLSSQLMEGVTDFVVKEHSSRDSEQEAQAGKFSSGQKLASIIETTSGNVEKKFLHDYAYTIFEDRLQESGKIISLTSDSLFAEVSNVSDGRRFIRLKAKATFLDAIEILNNLEALVDMQEAISIVAVNDFREALLNEIENLADNSSKKVRLAQLKSELERFSKSQIPKDKASNDRLQYKNIAAVLEHGFKRRLDLSMDMRDCRVNADLKRDCLKDSEDFVFKTYSRMAEVELVLLGMVTQCRAYDENAKGADDFPIFGGGPMSEMIRHTTMALQGLEAHFHRPPVNQIIVHPIALYLEL
ncbi:DUF6414 family protein [Pseudomonas soli]|uniref:Uncharacterized protein n=1 Tax=Pseudomonas soli TaxID=1306993 RepID=A0A1H9A584_9PSED|nr:hypothetical protein [Pseudomonas soli]SEP71647.1 hypothetical protein SAMN05216230_101304 [Pseudomonas soli]